MILSDEIITSYLSVCQNNKMLSRDTVKAYKIDLSQFLSFCVMSSYEINKITIECYFVHLNKKYKPKSVKRKIASLKTFFNYLFCEEIIDANPFSKIHYSVKEPTTLPKTIPAIYIQNILSTAYLKIRTAISENTYSLAVRNAALTELLFASGIRVSELCGLKKIDVNLVENFILVYGKGRKERFIQIENPEVIEILKSASQINTASEYFFSNRKGERLSEQAVRKILSRLAKDSGIAMKITPHMFRHSFATLLLDEGVDIRYIQQLLGHSSITTTQIYTHVSGASQKNILATKHPRNIMKIRFM